MIETKLINVLNAVEPLQELSEKSMCAKAAFQVAKLIRVLNDELSSFDTVRKQLVWKYGIKDENGELVYDGDSARIDSEKREQYNSEINELFETKIEIAAEPLSIELLSELKFTPNQMSLMSDFIGE